MIYFLVFAYFDEALIPILFLIAALNILLGVLARYSTRRTELGEKWFGECAGFRDFIKKVKINEIQEFAEEDPDSFYDILPYAYTMRLTENWFRYFKDFKIHPPYWYVDSNESFDSMILINSLSNNVGNGIRIYNDAHSSGSGYSGDFGGGFSGGGGGGMGGGTW